MAEIRTIKFEDGTTFKISGWGDYPLWSKARLAPWYTHTADRRYPKLDPLHGFYFAEDYKIVERMRYYRGKYKWRSYRPIHHTAPLFTYRAAARVAGNHTTKIR